MRLSSLLALLSILGAPLPLPAGERPDPDSLLPLLGTLEERLGYLERHRRSPRAALGLWSLDEAEGQADATGRRRALAAIVRVAEDGRAPLAVRRLAQDLRAQRLRAAGRDDEARAAWTRLGLLRSFWVVGPFDNDGRAGFQRADGPEQGLDLDRPVSSKHGALAWRPLPHPPADGRVHLHPLLLPRGAVTAYALAGVRLRRPARALLHLGCDDGCKLWLDGVELVADPGSHPLRLDQHVRRVRLAAGDHSLLVKVAQDESAMGFALALTDERGQPLAGLEEAADEAALRRALAPRAAPPELSPEAVEGLAAWFEAQAQAADGPTRARRLAEAALALYHLGSGDQRARRAEQHLKDALAAWRPSEPGAAAPPEALAGMLWAALLGEDEDPVRVALEEAARLAPRDPRPPHRLGLLRQVRGDADEALRRYRQALALAPGHLPSQIGRAEALADLRLPGLAARELEALVAAHPEVPDVLAAAGQQARQQGDLERARALFERLAAQRADHGLALRALHELALARGDLPAALGWLDRLQRLDPLRTAWWQERGALLQANGRADEALAAFREAGRICPADPQPLQDQADARLRLGQADVAVELLRAALALAPQDAALRRRIAALEPAAPPFYEGYRADPQELLRPGPGPEALAAGAERLLELHVVRLHPNGMAARFRQQIVRVLDARAAERLRTFQVDYAPGRQEVRILSHRLRHADGGFDDGVLVQDQSVSEPWFNMYYDVHVRQVTFPELRPGDLVELSTLVDDLGGEALLSDYFGDLVQLQFEEPVRRASYVLLVPPGREVEASADARLRHEVRPAPDGSRALVWTSGALPGVVEEPGMPGLAEEHASLHLSSLPRWPELSRWYHGQIADALVPGPEVRALASELVAGLTEPLDRVRAIYRFVADGTRYVGLEFGIHSYVPYQCDQVLQRKFGDCKDKSALLVALFESVGIPARLALVRMARLGRLPDQPASLAAFNHAICYLPGQDVWLDGTATLYDALDLPAQDQGVQALVVEPDGAALRLTPVTGPDRNWTELELLVALAEDGGAELTMDMRVSGVLAPEMRLPLLGAEARAETFGRMLREVFPGVQVEELALDGLLEPERPLGLRARLRLPALAAREAGGLELPALARETRYQSMFAGLEQRRHDLLLGPAWRIRWSVKLEPPLGFALGAPPGEGALQGPFGQVRFSSRPEGTGLRTEAVFELSVPRVPAAGYADFRAFLEEADQLLGRRVRLEPKGGAHALQAR
ncbi:MAG TPA: DUF3857 domain-containing protein [Myxococcota bacterium]|nr:DUF3857 domain-containing protein [Myxococcota bacterium]HRY95232.1 DUF3857 domain-containing protein [Myxococcota bacterium]HSA20750.1 DUF3857 domain-containing protein [Myxococcota bacterium]